MPSERYNTRSSHIVLSVIAGAVTGGVLIALDYVWGTGRNLGIPYLVEYGLRPTITVFVVALIIWAIGIIVVALPIWWVLHKLRLRHWSVAVLGGLVTTFVVGFALQTRGFELVTWPGSGTLSASDSGGPTVVDNHLTPHGWWNAAEGSLELGAAGSLVALVGWLVAYRKVDSAPT